ncbi:hypothetical protein HDF16_005618 [Granulicella aggregans]|uniref:Uncharacterized protein n=1 Tax=Granulicella aggregans TaxID=474949 RepID=A0A7W7ZJF0_9BACT|nr:hypothetical protein [Granulicella aggregans]
MVLPILASTASSTKAPSLYPKSKIFLNIARVCTFNLKFTFLPRWKSLQPKTYDRNCFQDLGTVVHVVLTATSVADTVAPTTYFPVDSAAWPDKAARSFCVKAATLIDSRK